MNLMSPADYSSKQNEWIMSWMMALWIRLPIVILLWLFDLPYWNADDCPINNAKSRFPSGEAGKEIHLAYRWKWAVSVPSQPVAQSSFIIHRTKQTINSAAMYEGWKDATSCEWWGAKNQRPHSFLALMAITSPDSTSKMRLIICTDPFKEDWLDLMPSQTTHKYLLHIKQLCMLSVIAHWFLTDAIKLLFQVWSVKTVNAMLVPRLNYATHRWLIMQWNWQDIMSERSLGNYRFGGGKKVGWF